MTADFSKIGARSASGGGLLLFFLLAYAVMWACFITVATVPIPAHTPLGTVLVLLGAFAPSLAALGLTMQTEGRGAVEALLLRVIQWRVSAKFYVFAVTYMAAIKLAAALIHRVATGAWPRFGHESLGIISAAIVISTPIQAGEEIGWRGYALPRLTARFGLARASILLGLIWGFWHLPQFFIRDGDSYRQSFPVFVLQVTALSVAFAWLYARTNGSLLLTMLLHAAVNNSKDIVPSAVPGGTHTFGFSVSLVSWLTVALLWACAAYFLVNMPKTKQATPP